MSDINLNFVNQSDDTSKSEIVIYQQNQAESFDNLSVAWVVIKNCGRGDHHRFEFPMVFEVAANDSWGNHTLMLHASKGEAFEVVQAPSGNIIQRASKPAANPNEIEIVNGLTSEDITGDIFRGGRLLAFKAGVLPEHKAAFQFGPKLFIGAASGIEEGNVLSSAQVQTLNTELNLEGISSADIVMKGGDGEPLTFSLENIKYS